MGNVLDNTYGLIVVRFGVVAINLSHTSKAVMLSDFAIRVDSPAEFVLVKNRGGKNEQVFGSIDEVFGYIRAFYDMQRDSTWENPIRLQRENIIMNITNEFETAIHNFIVEGNVE